MKISWRRLRNALGERPHRLTRSNRIFDLTTKGLLKNNGIG
jgi:hypothetical protein